MDRLHKYTITYRDGHLAAICGGGFYVSTREKPGKEDETVSIELREEEARHIARLVKYNRRKLFWRRIFGRNA